MDNSGKLSPERLKYLHLLAASFPTVEAISAEISRIGAQLSLPRGTEHFMSDIHGEYEAFCHIMNNCSGMIREKVQLWLGDRLTRAQADALCTLIYYPDAILRQHHQLGSVSDEWYREQCANMLHLARMLSSKYTRERVRAAMPDDWAFLLEELMHDQGDEGEEGSEQTGNRRRYHLAIVDSLIAIGSCDSLVTALAGLVKNLAVDRLHVVGDIYDRGPRADSVMDILRRHYAVDIQWGNHDILWMGAASGNEACIAAVLRNSLAYGNMDILERGYGIPLRGLSQSAQEMYPSLAPDAAMLHAVTVMMFKLEGQIIRRHPEYGMDDRLLLDHVDRETGTVEMDGKRWELRPLPLDTVDPADPWALSAEERRVMDGVSHALRHSPRLREHITFLYRKGSVYRSFNGNLLYHGCVPLNGDGSFAEKELGGKRLSGRALMDYCDQMARQAFYTGSRDAVDFMWYLWCGADSPVCGRQVKTFARAFVPDEASWHEPRNPYYDWYNREETCERILREFGLEGEDCRIINGHTPIRVTHGESPLKAGGRLVVIDGGFCRAYQKTTGIAGYTLIANSHGLRLMSHQPFTSLRDAQESGQDIHSQSFAFAVYPRRQYVRDTDQGRELQERMDDLIELLQAVRSGAVRAKT